MTNYCISNKLSAHMRKFQSSKSLFLKNYEKDILFKLNCSFTDNNIRPSGM
jgi:hypothetical protein